MKVQDTRRKSPAFESFLQEEQRHGGPKGVGTIKADKRLGYNSIRTDIGI